MIGSEDNDQNEITKMFYPSNNKKSNNQELFICDNMEPFQNMNKQISTITMSPISNSIQKMEFAEVLIPLKEELGKIYDDDQSINRNSQANEKSIDIYQSPLSPVSIASENLEIIPTVIISNPVNNISLISNSSSLSCESENGNENENKNKFEKYINNCNIKYSQSPTVFEHFTEKDIKWCRYCGTTQTSSWRHGPWGKKTLCNKHGCDYKGYGFTIKLPRLNLNSFMNEPVSKRIRPVIQEYCCKCFKNDTTKDNMLIMCNGCFKSYHQNCQTERISDSVAKSSKLYYCSEQCEKTKVLNRIDVLDLPRKNLPFMFNKGITTRNTEIKKSTIKKVQPKIIIRTKKKNNINSEVVLSNTNSNSNIIKIYKHKNIPIPSWRVCNTRSKKRKHDSDIKIHNEDISDEIYIKRHRPLELYEREDRFGLLNQTSIKKELREE